MAAKASEEGRRTRSEQGGWITVPFITGSAVGLTVATSGVASNLIVYLVKQLGVKSIDASQISNVVLGCASVAPVFGAVIADSYFGCFTVFAVCSFLTFLSMVVYTLTATLPSLRPTPCTPGSDTCQAASTAQLALFFAAAALMCVAAGGTKFIAAAMGANQLDSASERDTFFNWYYAVLYAASLVGVPAVVYLQDGVSWGWGFGACAIITAASWVVLLLGARHYRRSRPAGSPFTGLAQVVVAALRKWKVAPSTEPVDYYYGPRVALLRPRTPTACFRCLNWAAVKTEGDIDADGSTAKPWRLCTVEQVEDLKAILRLLPLWSTSVILNVTIDIQASLTVLQALTVDCSLGPHFSIPAGSLNVSSLAATTVSLFFLDRCAFPAWRKLRGRNPTPLQRVGLGHVITAAAMVGSALVERRRMALVRAHHLVDVPGSVVPMSVLWLLLPLVLEGVGEAMQFPGHVALYYQAFPASLRSSAMGMIALIVALGFYLSSGVVDLVTKLTDWLPDDLNASKLERVYWLLAVGGLLNFGLYVMCARVYTYQSAKEKAAAGISAGDEEGFERLSS